MDPYSRAPKKNTSHGNEVLPQDTTHLIQRPCYQRGSSCRDPTGNWTTEDLLTIVKRRKLQWYGHVSCSSGPAKTILQRTVKGGRRVSWCFEPSQPQRITLGLREEYKADRGRGGKTTSGNGQAWSLASPRGQWKIGKMEKTGCKIICGAPTTLAVK